MLLGIIITFGIISCVVLGTMFIKELLEEIRNDKKVSFEGKCQECNGPLVNLPSNKIGFRRMTSCINPYCKNHNFTYIKKEK